MNIDLDFWILKLSDTTYYKRGYAFSETKKAEYVNIPSSITYNQIFKLLFLIRYVYDNMFDDGTIIIKKITTKQIAHILNYIFGYEILSEENIINEKENNRIKNIVLSYLEYELSSIFNNRNNDENEHNYVKSNSFFGIDNIDEILDGDKYFYYRLQENHPFVKVDGEKEPLIFRDINKIKEAIKYTLKEIKHPEKMNVYDRSLKKDVICLMKSLKGEKHYIIMNKGEAKNFYNKLSYINILSSNKYRKIASKIGSIEYPLYVPVNGNKTLDIKEVIFLLNKIYGYKELKEDEIKILNDEAYKGYYGYIHPEVEIHFVGTLNQSIQALRYNAIDDYSRPNVSRTILERQVELAPESKKKYFSKKLQELKENEEPEHLIISALGNLV